MWYKRSFMIRPHLHHPPTLPLMTTTTSPSFYSTNSMSCLPPQSWITPRILGSRTMLWTTQYHDCGLRMCSIPISPLQRKTLRIHGVDTLLSKDSAPKCPRLSMCLCIDYPLSNALGGSHFSLCYVITWVQRVILWGLFTSSFGL